MKKHYLLRFLAVLFGFTLMAAACGEDNDETQDSIDAPDDTSSGGTGTTSEDVVEVTQDESLLTTIQARGELVCGVSGAAVAFSETQSDGSQIGFDADYCRAVAAAILGDAEAVKFVALTAAERFTAVQTGAVDLLMRNTTWTQSRDSEIGMDFGPTTYYDGQQFMGRAGDGFSAKSDVADLAGLTICTNSGTTTEKNVADAADAAGVSVTLGGPFEDFDQVTQAFQDGTCDVITTDGSALVGRKAVNEPNDWVIFPATPISKEPLGPTYRQNDSKFADVVNWTVYATIIADEYDVTMANVDSKASAGADGVAEVVRLLGGEGELQTGMGLAADAFYQVIKQVGNYDEIYARNLNPVGLTREGSANAGWLDGGLIYAPPAR